MTSKKKIKYHHIDIFRYWKKEGALGRYGNETWYVQNKTTWKAVPTSSEAACNKIIEVALAELNEEPHTVKRASLELKAEQLIR